MKIWNSYGSEHSANMVMIGQFKNIQDAEDAQSAIDKIKQLLIDDHVNYEDSERFSRPMLDLLMDLKVHSLNPREIEQLNYDVRTELKGDKIVVTTDESEISAFLKILLDYSAKVEVYSAHDYENTGEGR
jgi:hypothetical protein